MSPSFVQISVPRFNQMKFLQLMEPGGSTDTSFLVILSLKLSSIVMLSILLHLPRLEARVSRTSSVMLLPLMLICFRDVHILRVDAKISMPPLIRPHRCKEMHSRFSVFCFKAINISRPIPCERLQRPNDSACILPSARGT